MTKAERNAEIIRRHQEGASLRCIAAEVGLSYEGVRLILNAAGFGKAKDPIDVAAAWRLYQHGWSMEAIGKRLHADTMTVCRAFQRHGLPARPRGRPTKAFQRKSRYITR